MKTTTAIAAVVPVESGWRPTSPSDRLSMRVRALPHSLAAAVAYFWNGLIHVGGFETGSWFMISPDAIDPLWGVFSVPIPKDWKPDGPSDLPPAATSYATPSEAADAVAKHNRRQIESGDVRSWAVLAGAPADVQSGGVA